ncbi:MAG TPA: ribbon-helix-helix protein, CopG family [Nitriliruptorales bacterium]
MSEPDRGTSGGVELTDAKLDELADEAERGYEPGQLRTRSRRGRPPMGASAAAVFHVRLQPALRDALEDAADAAQTTSSEIVRRALRQYLGSGSSSETREAS